MKQKNLIYTDDYKSYKFLKKSRYSHSIVNHSNKQYVNNTVHTNTIENFWSLLKRTLKTYIHVSKNIYKIM
ncbi:hypothetical protein E7Y35_00390 [Spiroplasma sp. SV19]|nr:hypothetical protein E7Y35_00390 [Spiroplasma sp. SV19]